MVDIFNDVRDIIAKHSSLGAEALTPETNLDELNIQSLDLVEVMFEIEERFKIEIPYNAKADSRLEFTTVGQIAEAVRAILAKSSPST